MIQEKEASSIYHDVAIEFLPCVATFDSYPDEHGNTVRYLARVDYYPNGEEISLDGLLSFVGVDDSVDDSSSGSSDLIQSQTRPPRRKLLFPGISGVVVGPGFKDERDVESIRNFIQTLTQRVILVEAVPTEARMQEDNASEIARAIMEGINGMTAGERMGLFALDMAHHLIHRAFEQEANALPKPEGSIEPDKVQVEPERPERQQEYFDPNKNRYACRKCRTVLFGQDNMEDPPHTPSAHSFSRRKRLTINGCNTSICHSIFLTDGLSWMGDTQAAEGKLMCPKCSTKVGTWQWSGAQCSCMYSPDCSHQIHFVKSPSTYIFLFHTVS